MFANYYSRQTVFLKEGQWAEWQGIKPISGSGCDGGFPGTGLLARGVADSFSVFV